MLKPQRTGWSAGVVVVVLMGSVLAPTAVRAQQASGIAFWKMEPAR